MAKHNILGDKGEDFACRYLEGKGFEILCRNWRHKRLEVDIIAKREDFLVVVEVKTRSSNAFGYPESFVDRQKMQNLINAAAEYMRQNGLECGVRFDVVALTKRASGFEVEHFEDAFNSTHAFDW